MDQEAFGKWWEEKRRSTFAQIIAQAGQEKAEVIAREAWSAALQTEILSITSLSTVDTLPLLEALALKGGPLAALAEAGLLFAKKGEDYNTGFTRDEYFPMGLASYSQMLWVKALRLVSFAKSPRQENFEGPRDTCLDLISYAAFCADWLKRTRAKEKANG